MSIVDRTSLKAYFKKGKAPSEEQFADFINATINQAEDGIEKKPGEPLRITADRVEINSKISLNAPSTNTSEKESEIFISAERNTLNLSAEEVKVSGNISMNNLSTSKTLGDKTTSDTTIPSQKAVKNYVDKRLPSGLISMWSGAEIPDEWVLCNGENGTPDLRGRFVVGFDKDNPAYNQTKKTGGEETVMLSIDQLPAHSHEDSGHEHDIEDDGHNHNNDDFNRLLRLSREEEDKTPEGKDKKGSGTEVNIIDSRALQSNKTGIKILSGNSNIQNTGGNQPHENRPPYYVLAYIMKL